MRAIVNTGPDRLEWLDWPLPEPGPGEVRIRTAACGVCATDLEMIGGWGRTGFPAIPGHEWSGVVDSVGDSVAADWVGRHVVAENVLSDGGEVGFQHAGGYGHYFVTEATRLHPLPEAFPLTTAALIEPLAVCVRGLRRLRPVDLAAALVLGDGAIGLLTVALLRRAGVSEVHLVGGRPRRLEMGRMLGAAMALDYHDLGEDLAGAICGALRESYPNVVEASGSAAAAEAAVALAGAEGKVLVLGDYAKERARFRWMRVILGQLEIIGSNASAGAWEEAVSLAVQGAIPLDALVTHRLPAHRFEEAVGLAQTSREAIKVVLEWEAG